MNALKLKKLVPLAALTAMFGVGGMSTAHAAQLVYNLTTTFSGETPDNTYTATFDDSCGPDCVTLTMSVSGSSTTEFIDGSGTQFGWGFNFNTAKDVTDLNFTYMSGNDADSILQGTNSYKADGDGNFDFLFQWSDPANRLVAGQTSVYEISLTGLTLSDFDFSSECTVGCGTGSYFSAAHVQGIPRGEGSGWIGDGDGGGEEEELPEPSMALLIGAGLLGLWATRRRQTV